MQVLVLGGTGRTGRLIVEALVDSGHSTSVAGRRDPNIEGVAFRQLDLMKPDDLRAAARDVDAVVSALASGKGNPVCSGVARALSEISNLRYISIGGAGVDVAGDRKGPADHFIGGLMRRMVPEMLADRQAELAILQQSHLRWTMLRPPRVTDKPATGVVGTSFDRPATTAITRGDLARAVRDALQDASLFGRAPFVFNQRP